MSGQRPCGAKRRDGGSCKGWAMAGQTRCRMHGGSTPSHRRAGARRVAEAQAVEMVRRAGVDVEVVADPVRVLRELASEAMALKEFFRSRVDQLQELRYESGSGEQLRSEVALFERALDRAERFAHDLAKLNISEREVRVDEAKVILIAEILGRVLANSTLGLDPGRQAEARLLLVQELESA